MNPNRTFFIRKGVARRRLLIRLWLLLIAVISSPFLIIICTHRSIK